MTRPGDTIKALILHDCEVEEGAWIEHAAELEMTAVKVKGGIRWEGHRCDGSRLDYWDEVAS